MRTCLKDNSESQEVDFAVFLLNFGPLSLPRQKVSKSPSPRRHQPKFKCQGKQRNRENGKEIIPYSRAQTKE
jgi:hypothetical protein